jgi:hypothetical protein
MPSEWLVALGIAAAVLLQILQTIQIAIVGRKVTRTLAPPPAATCRVCGGLTLASSLRNGVCGSCEPTRPTSPERPSAR